MARKTGTRGNDRIDGTGRNDDLSGRSGSDGLFGKNGADRISGGEGRDRLFGGNGDDVLFGFGASDRVEGSGDITAARVGSGFGGALFATSAPGDPDRLFIVQKSGAIRILDPDTGQPNATPFLTIPSGELGSAGEEGLLGMAFHPDYATNGKFYVYIANDDSNIEVREYQRSTTNPDLADPASSNVILRIPHPRETNHNGGWMSFGPDGMLYISVGDGGGGNDPGNNAQDKGSLLGKILRIDVDGDDFSANPDRDYAIPDDNPFVGKNGDDEIWALGLRNAWRPSFDRLTGDLYIADVGQGDREEINFQPGDSNGGENYGWRIREGDIDNPGVSDPRVPGLTDPILDYGHNNGLNGGFSVTGGYVYRGPAEGMKGVYFYADFVTNQIWSFRVVGGKAVDAENRTAQIVAAVGDLDQISSFGEDGRGNLYIVGFDGEIYRIDPGKGAGDGADLIKGGDGRDSILGGVGNDTLHGDGGRDTLIGNDQNDVLRGGAGVDVLTGGDGEDRFIFVKLADSPLGRPDVVEDFEVNSDTLGLSRLDARPGQSGNQAFSFVGTDAFTGLGQVRVVQDGTSTRVEINLRGGLAADMAILLRNVDADDLSQGDFIL